MTTYRLTYTEFIFFQFLFVFSRMKNHKTLRAKQMQSRVFTRFGNVIRETATNLLQSWHFDRRWDNMKNTPIFYVAFYKDT